MTAHNLPLEDRFMLHVEPEPNTGCWLWTGALWRGYGAFWVGGRIEGAHRVAWKFQHGPIPAGQFCLHRCDQPGCVCVEHLFLGNHRDNMRDMARKGRGRKSKFGMPFGVFRDRRGARERPFVAKVGDHSLGYFATREEAGIVAEQLRDANCGGQTRGEHHEKAEESR